MDSSELDEMLAQTLEDHRLSRGEKRALKESIAQAGMDERERAHARSRAFDLARDAVRDPQDRRVLEWLEETVKLLLPAEDDAAPARAYFSPDDHIPRRIGELLEHARQRIDICVFTITDDRVADAIRRAHERGVAVRIVSDDDKSNDKGSDIDRLREAGIPVRLERSDYHMHHKFAIFDGAALVTGSYNWTRTAAQENEENLVVTGDRSLLRTFEQCFEKLWGELSP